MFAEFAEATVALDPVVTVVMRLLAPPAMTDDRIAQTDWTPTKDRFRTSRPVEARLAMIRRKWDKGNRTAWRLSYGADPWSGMRIRKRALSFLLTQLQKNNSLCLWLPRIGRLNAQNHLNEPSPSALILQGCEKDLFVRNNRRANEAVQFRKFFVHIGVAAFE